MKGRQRKYAQEEYEDAITKKRKKKSRINRMINAGVIALYTRWEITDVCIVKEEKNEGESRTSEIKNK